jgi:ATP-binding cassette, subfamily B, bacterial PglK
MIKQLIFDILKYSSKSQIRLFIGLQLLITLMSIFELITIASLGIFIKVLSDPAFIYSNDSLYYFFKLFEFSEVNFLVCLGGALITILLISGSISVITIWRVSNFASRWGTEFGDRLYKNYLNKNWLYHTKQNSSFLIKKISIESPRITDKLLVQLLLMNARVILIVIISIGLLIYNPLVTIVGFFVFSISYILLYKSISNKLQENSAITTNENTNRFKTVSEGLNGILDVIIFNKKFEFYEKFRNSGIPYYKAHGANVALTMIPKFFMEFVIFGGFALIIIILLLQGDFNLSNVLPTIAVYGVVGIKFLPAFQQLYNGLTQIRGNISAWEEVKQDITIADHLINFDSINSNRMVFNSEISINNISFNYPDYSRKMINNVSMDIKVNSTIGIIGPSGSGKSTLANIISGLITPSSGSISVDGIKIDKTNLVSWQRNIGYVSQDVFLTDHSISENVAFGVNKENINLDKVNLSLKQANLLDFIDELPNGINTIVGEKGVQISGGQRQRISIARALYWNPEVIIFDEATSSLDGINEKYILNTIENIEMKLIIIIAHRLNTIKFCDQVILLNEGQIIDQGNFNSISKRQKIIRDME